ncbi:thiopurine S-methyltransferase [Arenicella xantha]|uniref:Thiopurine S-methyltransferase n=1 Tax=Arenicella xantha TaxID=644221 RepID=A0A395JTC5_9GAMM|nr:thiopurine S-methyltransferase [Arenicella xantha]RBP53805.1 thiopurine S-methyltransferase [Arenicella xantha]
MEEQFWHQRWQDRNIGFHEGKPNTLLVRQLERLNLTTGDRIFLPLCGKTQDIAYLLSLGFHVVGIEFSAIAVDELFLELDIKPTITQHADLSLYQVAKLDIYVGDFFALQKNMLGHVDAVYDRAALVALPLDMRKQYTAQLVQISSAAPQLLIVFAYDQTAMNGPPFSLVEDEIMQHYAEHYTLELLEHCDASALFNKRVQVSENAWLLQALGQ